VQALKNNYLAGQSKLEARAKELQAAQTPVEEKIKTLTEALAWETKRREAVERMAADAFKRRRELEARLAKNEEAEKAVQQAMAEKCRPRSGTERQDAEVDRQTKGAGRRGALNAFRGFVEGKIGSLKQKPRESAEPQRVEGPQAQPYAPQKSSGAEQTKFEV